MTLHNLHIRFGLKIDVYLIIKYTRFPTMVTI